MTTTTPISMVEAYAERDVEISGLDVVLGLLGQRHEFTFEGHAVEVILPGLSYYPPTKSNSNWPILEKGSYFTNDPENPDTTILHIYRFWVRIAVGPIEFPLGALGLPINAYGVVPASNQEKLKALSLEEGRRAWRAFFYWLEIVKWRTGKASLGIRTNKIKNDSRNHGARLYQIDGTKLWGTGGTLYAERTVEITREDWKGIQILLKTGESAPLWFLHLHDATRHLYDGELSLAVISAAIACETVLRSTWRLEFPQILSPAEREEVDHASIRSILNRWGKLTGASTTELDGLGMSDVQNLFNARNSIMHSGSRTSQLQEPEGLEMIEAATRFVSDADLRYRKRLGRPTW